MKLKLKTVRNWLNIVFMLGAVVGLGVYFLSSRQVGIYIILIAMVVKFCEASLRMMPMRDDDED